MNALASSGVRGLLLAMAMASTFVVSGGCGKTTTTGNTGDKTADNKRPDYELYATAEDDLHVRLRIDAAKKEARAEIYDNENKEIVPIEPESLTLNILNGKASAITLKAQPAKSDPKGKSSVFQGTDDRLAKSVDHKKVEVTTTIDGKQRIFKHEKHH